MLRVLLLIISDDDLQDNGKYTCSIDVRYNIDIRTSRNFVEGKSIAKGKEIKI